MVKRRRQKYRRQAPRPPSMHGTTNEGWSMSAGNGEDERNAGWPTANGEIPGALGPWRYAPGTNEDAFVASSLMSRPFHVVVFPKRASLACGCETHVFELTFVKRLRCSRSCRTAATSSGVIPSLS